MLSKQTCNLIIYNVEVNQALLKVDLLHLYITKLDLSHLYLMKLDFPKFVHLKVVSVPENEKLEST